MKKWPFYGWIGILLILIFWTVNWTMTGYRTNWAFFPLWAGYILTVDAIVFSIKGSSLLHRGMYRFLALFLVSVPCWWLFELINSRARYWVYEGREHFSNVQYFILASIAFSTVTPAMFETAELIFASGWIRRLGKGPVIHARMPAMVSMFTLGWIMLGLVLCDPAHFPYFVWISVYFILEPLNIWLGFNSLIRYTARGDWRPVIALWTGSLICGFFWEMWNYLSYPKWLYHIPHFNSLHVFEMPLIGYLGYLPFSLELFAMYYFMCGILGVKGLLFINRDQ